MDMVWLQVGLYAYVDDGWERYPTLLLLRLLYTYIRHQLLVPLGDLVHAGNSFDQR